MSQEYKSTNTGLLSPSMVKTGDKLIIIEDAYSTFSETKQQVYWNAKMQLPDGTHKLAGLFESACDEFVKVWGKMTADWTGHTIMVEIKTSKAGNSYIVMTPSDDPRMDMEKIRKEKFEKDVAKQEAENKLNPPPAPIEYPSEQINPDDIPF
jgi:hypothetical protein